MPIPDDNEFEQIKTYVEKITGQKIRNRKIRVLGVNPQYHVQPKRLIEVGKWYADLEPGAPSEEVIAIFETVLFCVCTPDRGAGIGLPYFFARDSVFSVEEFDESDP